MGHLEVAEDVCCIDETEMMCVAEDVCCIDAVLVSLLLFLYYCDPYTQMLTRFGMAAR